MAQSTVNIMTTLCCIKKLGKTLMLHRIKKAADVHQGKWNGLGGKFLPGESPEECVIREVKEESGYSIKNPKLHGFLTFPGFKEGQDWQMFIFTATEFGGAQIECDEGKLEWIADEKLKELALWEGDYLFLDWLKQNRFFTGKFVYEDKKLISHSVLFY